MASPDLSVELPQVRLPENQVDLQANLTLDADGTLGIQKVMVGSRQAGRDWLELSATPTAQTGLAVAGKVDLATLAGNVPSVAPYISAGSLLLKANLGDPKNGVRKVGFSVEVRARVTFGEEMRAGQSRKELSGRVRERVLAILRGDGR